MRRSRAVLAFGSPVVTSSSPVGRVVGWARWHRRSVAAALAVLGVLVVARDLRPPPPPTVAVMTAARSLPAGSTITPGDLVLRRVATSDVPDGAVRSGLVGRIVALPVRRGEILTDVRVLGTGLLAALGPASTGADVVAAPVHLADAATAALLRVGDTVDIVGAGEAGSASVVARDARVLVTPAARSGSVFGSSAPSGADGVVVLAVQGDEAVGLARAAAVDHLSVVIRR